MFENNDICILQLTKMLLTYIISMKKIANRLPIQLKTIPIQGIQIKLYRLLVTLIRPNHGDRNQIDLFYTCPQCTCVMETLLPIAIFFFVSIYSISLFEILIVNSNALIEIGLLHGGLIVHMFSNYATCNPLNLLMSFFSFGFVVILFRNCQHSLSQQFYVGCSLLDWFFFPQCDVIAFVAYIFPEVFDCSVQTK